MNVGPTIVIGLGSSGAYVIANLERILYEVLGDAPLDLFKLYAIDTDTQRKEDVAPPGRRRSQNIPIYESNLGQAIYDLKAALGATFNWCPDDLQIPGPGAGNLRSGGRLMFYRSFPRLWDLIRTATQQARDAAKRPETEQAFKDLLSRRGMPTAGPIVDPDNTAIYVIGTLAGGTCSGACVDLGYMIRDAARTATRTAVFFLPDGNAGKVFLENSWAALVDLEYFCEHPAAFNAIWPADNRHTHPYNGGPDAPYSRVYLLSSLNQDGVPRLPYSSSSNSPLIAMTAMWVATNLLGGSAPRMASLSNLNQQVPGPPEKRMFLNFNLRALSYPKYEISEAAACSHVATKVCSKWLDGSNCETATGTTVEIKNDAVRKRGRDLWAKQFVTIWRGVYGSVNPAQRVAQLQSKAFADPAANLFHEFTAEVQGSIYSQILEQLPGRERELQSMIKVGLASEFANYPNLTWVELFVEGLKYELAHTIRYWEELGIPRKADHAAWSELARRLIDRLLEGETAWRVRLLGERRNVARDEFEGVLTHLAMFLMRGVLDRVTEWIDKELVGWLNRARRTVESVQRLADTRRSDVMAQLQNPGGIVLKLSRSRTDNFAREVEFLAGQRVDLGTPLLRLGEATGEFEGLLALRASQGDGQDEKLFLELKDKVQPAMLHKLESREAVDILSQLQQQERINQALILRAETQQMSVWNKQGLIKSPVAVPSFAFAKTEVLARSLDGVLGQHQNGLPSMNYKGLPAFDHMVVFYQEGAGLEPSTLQESEFLKAAYEARMAERSDNLDPLGLMRQPASVRTEASG
jgi:hypothetical protein